MSSAYEIKIARFDSTGTQVGATVYANNNARSQSAWDIMPDGASGFWLSWYDVGGYTLICRYDEDGTPLFSVTTVNTATPQPNVVAPMTSDGADGVFVSWLEWPYSVGYMKARRVEDDGTLGAVIAVGDNSNGTQPRIVRDSAGGYLVAWTRRSITGDAVSRVLVQRYTAAGVYVWASPVSVDSEDVADGVNFNLEDLLPDGDDGAYVVYTSIVGATSTTRNVKANRIYSDGTLWADTGLVVCGAANAQVSPKAALEGVQYGDLPAPLVPGYKVWSAFVGELDACCFDGSRGDPIECYFEQPWWDAGEPDTVKLIDRVQFHTAEGSASFALTIETDEATVTLSLDVTQSGSTWGGGPAHLPTTMIWNQSKWGGRKAAVATTGVTPGVIGHRARVKGTCSATEKFVLEGWDIDAMILPERNYHQ